MNKYPTTMCLVITWNEGVFVWLVVVVVVVLVVVVGVVVCFFFKLKIIMASRKCRKHW